MAAWLAFAGALLVALIAGGFGIIQGQRTIAAQRALELEKLKAARQESELARMSASRSEYRTSIVQPFLEALDATIVASYAVVQIPDQHLRLAARVPALQRYVDRVMNDWLDAMIGLSRLRIRAFIAIDTADVPHIAKLLSEMVLQSRKLMSGRSLLFTGHMTGAKLAEEHNTYVRMGYRLLVELTAALDKTDMVPGTIDAAAIDELVPMLEHSGVVSLPYGTASIPSWIGIWEVDLHTDAQKYLEAITHVSHEEFSDSMVALIKELYERKDIVETNLLRIGERSEPSAVEDDLEIHCIPITFDSIAGRSAFVEKTLPTLRLKYPTLWSSYRAPVEILAE